MIFTIHLTHQPDHLLFKWDWRVYEGRVTEPKTHNWMTDDLVPWWRDLSSTGSHAFGECTTKKRALKKGRKWAARYVRNQKKYGAVGAQELVVVEFDE